MTGTVYKEIRQNLPVLLIALFAPLAGYALMVLFYLIMRGDRGILTGNDVSYFEMLLPGDNSFLFVWKLLGLLMIYYCAGSITTNLFSADEKKKWSYFMASTPRGVKRQIYGKYVILVMIYGTFLISQIFTEGFMNWLGWLDTGKVLPSFTNVYILMFFVQLLLRALEIPFLARYGVKVGIVMRLTVLGTAVVAFMIWLLFAPSAFDIIKNISEHLADFIMNFNAERMTDYMTFFISLLPCIAIPAYILSYFISCKGYLKGVTNYDK